MTINIKPIRSKQDFQDAVNRYSTILGAAPFTEQAKVNYKSIIEADPDTALAQEVEILAVLLDAVAGNRYPGHTYRLWKLDEAWKMSLS